jgi:hypothetical protein
VTPSLPPHSLSLSLAQVVEQLLPCKPILVDYYINNTNASVAAAAGGPPTSPGGGSYTAAALARTGGKVFDLQVAPSSI